MSEDIAYCVCRSSDTSRFMICCDNCDEWYHGDCISITEQLAKTITKFYCLTCRVFCPSLKIQYLKEFSSKSTSKHGTVRKKSTSPPRSNKVARYEDDATPEKRNYEDKNVNDQDETLRNKDDSSGKNNQKSEHKSRSSRKEANMTSAEKERINEKTHKGSEEEISEIDDGLCQCFQWMFEYNFLSWRGLK